MYLLAPLLERAPDAYLSGHASALSGGLAEASLPDPLGAKDLVRADPSEVAAVLLRRIRDDRVPLSRAILRYPKGFDPSAYRLLTSLDILDQYAYRLIVGRCAVAASERLAGSVVSMRPAIDGRGVWWPGASRTAWKLRQERVLEELHAHPDSVLLVLDVKQFFPSVTVEHLARVLNSLGVPSSGVHDVELFLNELNGLPGTVGGLPIGPDGSAVLGTAALVGVDRVLAGSMSVRFVDDIWVVAADSREAQELAELVASQLALIGLSENTAKRKILGGQDALEFVTDAEIDYLVRSGRRASIDDAMDLISSGIDEQKLSRVRFGLGALKAHQSVALVPRLLADPSLIDADPRAFGSYFAAVLPRLSDDDRGALVQLVVEDGSDHQIGRRLHIAAALARGELNQAHSQLLHEAAVGMSSRKHQLIRTHSLVAACRGARVERRINAGLECAEATDSLDLRRAIGDAHRRVTGRRRRVGVEHLCRIDPEVRPFLRGLC